MLNALLRIQFGLVICACVGGLPGSAVAGTIIKLNLGSVSPDVKYELGVFSTASDGNIGTDGDQDTAIEFTGFLDSEVADINTSTASFTMGGLTPNGQAQVFGFTVLQNFTGGSFTLYAPDDSILLQGNLAGSALAGPIGIGSGGLFTTTFGSFTGGTLMNYLDPASLVLSLSFTGVQTTLGPVGFAVDPGLEPQFGTLLPFTSDSSVIISADINPVPEPASLMLLISGGALVADAIRRRRVRASDAIRRST